MAANLDALGHGSGSWLSCIKHRFQHVPEIYLLGNRDYCKTTHLAPMDKGLQLVHEAF